MTEEVKAAAQRLEDEMGDWGSISMRLGDDWLADIRTVIAAARAPKCSGYMCDDAATLCEGCANELYSNDR